MISMKLRTIATTIAGNLALALVLFAHPSSALTVDVVSISPEPQMDITDMLSGAPTGVGMVGWLLDSDMEYTAVLSVDEAPAVVITPGADIAVDQPWVYDATAGTVTVIFTGTGLKQLSDGPDNAAIIAVVPPVAEGEDGPPVEMTGAWMSTNVQDWELIPPTQDNVAFGFSLTGPVGETGFFHMFMPQGIIDLLSEMNGKELTIQDLAVFNGNDQASMSITEIAGGAYIDINVTFAAAVVAPTANSNSVTKSITVQEQLPISLAANKTSLKKGATANLFGWLKSGRQNKSIEVWRKVEGESTFTKWKSTKTNKAGRYEVEFTARQSASYKVKYHTAGKVKSSSVETITVE